MASPCLLQSMAALSASFNKEHKAAQDLYQAARRSVTKQVKRLHLFFYPSTVLTDGSLSQVTPGRLSNLYGWYSQF